MIEKINLHLELFFANKILKYIYLLLCFICLVFPIYLQISLNGLYMFDTFVKNIFYINLMFISITYVYLTMARNEKVDEVLNCIHVKKGWYFYYVLIICILFIIYNIVIIVGMFIASIITNEYALLMNFIANYYLMNILLPQICFTLIIGLISRIRSFKVALPFLVVTIFLSSPFINLFTSINKPQTIDLLDNFIQIIIRPFSYFYQYGIYAVDELYGFQNEVFKIYIFIFWILVAVYIAYKSKLSHIKKGLQIVLICLSLVAVNIPQSMYRADDSWRYSYNDMNYYQISQGKNIYIKENQIDYHISNYQLKVKIRRQLEASGEILISSEHKRSDYVLTLYHGYHIKTLTSNQKIEFTQEGDYIYLSLANPIDQLKLKITYTGYHPRLYSNHQATQLPGYFPWYPMEGKKQIFVKIQNPCTSFIGFNPYNRVNAKFDVEIDTLYPIITNLSQKSESHYVGESDSFTLIGGNIKKTIDSQFKNYYPLSLQNNSNNDYIKDIYEHKEQLTEYMSNLFDKEQVSLKSKPIIIFPMSLIQVTDLGGYCEFDNYILVSNHGYISTNEYLSYYLTQNDHINSVLRDMLILESFIQCSDEEFIKQVNDFLSEYITRPYNEENVDENLKERYRQVVEFKKQFDKDLNELGVEQYMKKIAKEMEME